MVPNTEAPAASAAPPTEAAASTTTEAADAAKAIETPPLPEITVENAEKWADQGLDLLMTYGPRVLGALVLLFLAWVVSRWVRAIVLRALTAAKFDLTLSKFFANTIKWVVLLVAVLACLGTFGINITSFAAILGAIGLAIGLGFQGSLGNLAAGVMLLVFRPFKIGDAVIIAGQAGIIDGIDLFTTNLDTADNRRIILPNSAIFGSVIENSTHHPRRRVQVNVPIDPTADIERVRGVLLSTAQDVAKSAPGAMSSPAPEVALLDYAAPMPWAVFLWSATPQMGAVREMLVIELKRAIEAADIQPKPPPPTVFVQKS